MEVCEEPHYLLKLDFCTLLRIELKVKTVRHFKEVEAAEFMKCVSLQKRVEKQLRKEADAVAWRFVVLLA